MSQVAVETVSPRGGAQERRRRTLSGWVMLPLLILGYLLVIAILIFSLLGLVEAERQHTSQVVPMWGLIGSAIAFTILIILSVGFFTLQPNEAAVLLLFGAYQGSVRKDGFHWANPFFRKIRVSLRTRNFNTDKLKVNDQRGNPTEIAAVVVWHVQNTAQAVFDVDDYEHYVKVQSESAVRHTASRFPYDSSVEQEISLRGSMDEVSRTLAAELQERLGRAGVIVEEARLTHLAYAPEIAGAMLRRQQAEAIVSARFRIVEGAVGMVEAALEHLEKHQTVLLDDERKAAMVSNLLVVLCGEQAAQPVVNAGTLYSA